MKKNCLFCQKEFYKRPTCSRSSWEKTKFHSLKCFIGYNRGKNHFGFGKKRPGHAIFLKEMYKSGKLISFMKGKKHRIETKNKMSAVAKKFSIQKKEKRLQNLSKGHGWNRGLPRTWKSSGTFKKGHTLWQDEEYREKTVKAILKGLLKRPTSLERQAIEVIQKYNLPYKYTGDGSFLIGFKNPDFININGEKKLIEIGNVFHHQGNYIEKRSTHFAQYGWTSKFLISNKPTEKEIVDVFTL